MEAMLKGSDEAKWIEAATLDRYLQSIGQVVKCAGIDISAIDVSSANNTPQ